MQRAGNGLRVNETVLSWACFDQKAKEPKARQARTITGLSWRTLRRNPAREDRPRRMAVVRNLIQPSNHLPPENWLSSRKRSTPNTSAHPHHRQGWTPAQGWRDQKSVPGTRPNGVQLTNFKYPTADERDHDFLWRVHKAAPRKGRGRALEPVALRRRPRSLVHGEITRERGRARCVDINAFENLLHDNGVTILSSSSTSRRKNKMPARARLKEPRKLWKFNLAT